MTTHNSICPIWGKDFEAQVTMIVQTNTIYVGDSPRTGGGYQVNYGLQLGLVSSLSDKEKARLTTWLVDQRLHGNANPDVTREVIELARNKLPLPVDERAQRLLRYLASSTTTVAQPVNLDPVSTQDFSNWPFLRSLAWSESSRSPGYTEVDELLYLIDYLIKREWVELLPPGNRYSCLVTVDGHRQVAESETNVDSSQAFVAMWFDPKMDEAYNQGIEPAIEGTGYKPERIDRRPDVNKIDDAIIAGIRRSRFLVADFTQGDDGARGGVYFEAGLAFGLDIPVIYTCRRDMVDKLAFDTRQYNHILWDTPEELRVELKNRIEARIGRGPLNP